MAGHAHNATPAPVDAVQDVPGWRRLWQRVTRALLVVQRDRTLLLDATPAMCLQTLDLAGRPSVSRLEHRNLFTGGRRYHLARVEQGFMLTVTRKVVWSARRRTTATAVLRGKFADSEGDATRLTLHSRMKVLYFAEAFLIPAFMASIMYALPWSRTAVTLLVVTMVGLSWLSHRYTAAVEAHDMNAFVDKALAVYAPQSPALPAGGGDVVYESQRKFPRVWERFYQEHAGESE